MVGLEPDEHQSMSACVLIVEDEVLTRIAAAEFLRDSGFTVIEAANAHEAMAVLAAKSPIDLVFTDIQMPGSMDGLSLAKWLAQHRPGLPVILTSARHRDTIEGYGGRFVQKPYVLAVVEEHIRALLDS